MPQQALTPQQVQEAREAVAKHGSLEAAARALKIPRTTLQNRVKANNVTKPRNAGRSLDEFAAEYDKATIVPTRIKAALGELGDGGWSYEVEFCKLAGVSLADLSAFRDAFADYVVVVKRSGKRAWAGTKATANRMREMLR